MGAFKGAIGVGAQAIETDIHLSKDGVVVISHVSEQFALSNRFGLSIIGRMTI
jgi:glycerophosphoryl diester phosphodiesterase